MEDRESFEKEQRKGREREEREEVARGRKDGGKKEERVQRTCRDRTA